MLLLRTRSSKVETSFLKVRILLGEPIGKCARLLAATECNARCMPCLRARFLERVELASLLLGEPFLGLVSPLANRARVQFVLVCCFSSVFR